MNPVFVLAASMIAALFCEFSAVAISPPAWQQQAEMAAPEAFQAATADQSFVYAISSQKIAKYDRVTGKRLAVSTGEAKHLNSGVLWQGKLLSAHSNYPTIPEISEIKQLDLESMELSTLKDFGDFGGSLVWIVRHNDHWWCNFAKYGDRNAETFLVKFDNRWNERARWTYPDQVIRLLGRYSLSGGLWLNEELLVSGHDKPELYRLRLPATGNVLEFVGSEPVPFTGQGFAIDPVTNGLVGIKRADRKVVFVSRDVDLTAEIPMPNRGVCAHRGASATHPENTLSAFREAIRLGAHMIEFDVAFSQDKKLVLMHDSTVNRTTNGTGTLSSLSLKDLKQLDAGMWKNERFKGEQIPTLNETLAMMPSNIWLNVHLKGGAELAEEVTKQIVAAKRLHQAFLACGQPAALAAKRIDARVQICNMERQANSQSYVDETIAKKSDFIQLLGGKSVAATQIKQLKDKNIRINFCCVNEEKLINALFDAGVEFPLVDRLEPMLKVADKHGITRLRPIYQPPTQQSN